MLKEVETGGTKENKKGNFVPWGKIGSSCLIFQKQVIEGSYIEKVINAGWIANDNFWKQNEVNQWRSLKKFHFDKVLINPRRLFPTELCHN